MNKKHFLLAAAFAAACVLGAAEVPPKFASAKPIWPETLESTMNAFVDFHSKFDYKSGKAVLRITGSTVYRVRVNGAFAGYGPARAPTGFFRVDEIDITPQVKQGANEILVQVNAYNCNTFYYPCNAPFLLAEILVDGNVVCATGGKNAAAFTACENPTRITRTPRYSFQRGFTEAYDFCEWCFTEVECGEMEELGLREYDASGLKLLPRIVAYPSYAINDGFKCVDSMPAYRNANKTNFKTDRSQFPTSIFHCYAKSNIVFDVSEEMQRYSYGAQHDGPVAKGPFDFAKRRSYVFDAGKLDCGFIRLNVKVRKPGRLTVVFDELLDPRGFVAPLRMDGCVNCVTWNFEQKGDFEVETFEPYAFRYLQAMVDGGDISISMPSLRTYRNEAVMTANKDRNPDAELEKISEAARETLAQNSTDIFTDCPSRERAGWLCDSFFEGRAYKWFCGNTDVEKVFLENYLLPEKFADTPDGMVPMCWPSDHPDCNFIPNWAMWLLLEVEEYVQRSNDREFAESFRPRAMKLLEWFAKYENSDGLLEKLPGWNFVEWSKANDFTQDVSYPANMTYTGVLDAMSRLYSLPDLADKAKKLRATIREQSHRGRWFCDHAVRNQSGALEVKEDVTETCQYYAFFFGVATPDLDPDLWEVLVKEFGPQRKLGNMHASVHYSNAFIGNLLRLDLLTRLGHPAQALREIKGYYLPMAEKTGTLWEHDQATASCCHGFAGYVAQLIQVASDKKRNND